MLEELLKIGFLTGSRAYGTAKENSDYDIVYSIEDSERVDFIIAGRTRSPSNYFAGYYVYDGDKQINLIPVHPHDFLPWYLATKAMAATLRQSGIIDPIKKYSVFMGIVSLFKGTVKEQGNLSNYSLLKNRILNSFRG